MFLLNLYAYFGIAAFACLLLTLGWQMMRTQTMAKALAAFLGEERALKVINQGQLSTSTRCVIGVLLLATGLFLSGCVVRGLLT